MREVRLIVKDGKAFLKVVFEKSKELSSKLFSKRENRRLNPGEASP